MAANSTLQIEVVSVGIAETVRRLDSLGNAAGRNEAKVKLLTDSLGSLMSAQVTAVSSAANHASAMAALAQAMGLISASATSTASRVTFLNSQLGMLTSSSNSTTAAFQRKSSSGGIVNSTIQAMTAAALAYLGINFAKGIVEASDGWAMMQAKLKIATGTMEEAKKVQNDLFEVAQRMRVPLDDIGKLYTRMAVPMQRMGKDAKQTAEQVEFVSLALKLNGATGAEASSVMLQYSQSVNAGRLNGAEFNAVAEGAPGILRAIEAELKATGKFSEYSGKSLKQMGSDGEISFDLMNRAAQRALPKMREEFLALPLTVDGAMQRVKNAWFKAMGEMGEETGLGTKLAQAIRVIEDNIPKVRDALATAFILIYENFSKIVVVIEALIAIKLVMWIGGAATALTAMAGAATAMAVGVGVAEGAVLGFGRAMALMAGPVGIFIALIGVGLVQAYRAYQDTAPAVEKSVTDVTAKNTDARIKMVQAEIDKIDERNGKSKVTATPLTQAGGGSELSAQYERVQEFRKRLSTARTLIDNEMIRLELKQAEDKYTELALIEGKGTLKVFEETARIRREKIKGLDSQFGLSTEKKNRTSGQGSKRSESKVCGRGRTVKCCNGTANSSKSIRRKLRRQSSPT